MELELKNGINPPAYFVGLLSWFLPIEKSEDVELLLNEQFQKWAMKFGSSEAKFRYGWHTCWIIFHHHSASLTKIGGLACVLVGFRRLSDWMIGKFL